MTAQVTPFVVATQDSRCLRTGYAEDENGLLLLHAWDEQTNSWQPLRPEGVLRGMTILAKENLELAREIRRLETRFESLRQEIIMAAERHAPVKEEEK